jgi:amino acid adenylation domain-containing protein
VNTLDVLPAAERHQLVHAWNATEAAFPAERCIHELFEEQVERTPEATALVFEDTTLNYAELNAHANRLAHHLITLGVRPDTRVAIALPRGIEMVVALLATLKAAGAYVPLDPDYPAERLAFMLSDSAPRVVITQSSTCSALGPLPASMEVLLLDVLLPHANRMPAGNPGPMGILGWHLAYVMYTSGSTGRPKGVAMSQAALLNLVQWHLREDYLQPPTRTLQFAALSFDVAFQEIFTTLCGGGSLVLIHAHERLDPALLIQRVRDHRVQRVFLPCVALQALAQASLDSSRSLPDLTTVITAGEQLRITPALRRFFAGSARRLHNHYGPTESHVVSFHTLGSDASSWPLLPPIGTPIANARLYILGPYGNPVPIGATGEVHIGGISLARGYLNRPQLTAERFIPDPFAAEPGARMYKTGDIGRWQPDGTIEYLGRNDHQVKIRGFRIELGEIEAKLLEHPAVDEAIVLVHEHESENRQLVAYVVGDQPQPQALRAHLAETLPEYMVPAAYVLLEAVPLTPSGKLNRRALPAPEGEAYAQRAYEAPQGELESTLASIWCELLGLERVGRHDDFFALGGHSLLAVQLRSRMSEQLGCELPLTELFTHPTLSALANQVLKHLLSQLEPDDARELLQAARQV